MVLRFFEIYFRLSENNYLNVGLPNRSTICVESLFRIAN